MRGVWILLLLAVPVQGALLEDPADDVMVTFDGQAIGPAQGEPWTLQDLRALEIGETPFELTFQVNVTRLQADANVFIVHSVDYVIRFEHGLVGYELTLNRNMGLGTDIDPGYYARLVRRCGTSCFQFEAYEPTVDEGAGVFAVSIPRTALYDEAGRIPLPGHVFDGLRVEAYNLMTGGDLFYPLVRILLDAAGVQAGPRSSLRILDRMPDVGNTSYAIRMGFGDGDGATLSTQAPLRVSNGEATTLVFDLVLAHEGNEAKPFRLAASDVPRGWDVWFPVQDVDVPPSGRVVPVVVRVPFAHQHGAIETVTVRAASITDAAWADAEVGLHYAEVPQPAGHHDTVHLHSAKQPFFVVVTGVTEGLADPVTDGFAWFNTLEDDPGDEDVPVGSGPWPIGGQVTAGWQAFLLPSLAMGLDMAAGATGSALLEFRAGRDLDASGLVGEVLHRDAQGNETVVMTLAADGPFRASIGQQFDIEAQITPSGVPVVPYGPGGNLLVRFGLKLGQQATLAEQMLGGQAELLGGTLRLPLDEYHDTIDEAFSADQAVRLTAAVQERRVAPGSVLVFDAVLHHARTAPADFALTLHGHDGWGEVVAPQGTRAGAQELPIQVVVRIPADAPDGRKDMLLEAVDAAEPLRRSLLRLVVDVDRSAEAVDETERIAGVPKDKDSPGLGVFPVLAAAGLAGCLQVRRRRVRG